MVAHTTSIPLHLPADGSSIVLNLISDEVLVRVGHIVMDWNAIEGEFDRAIHVLLLMDDRIEDGWERQNHKKKRKLFFSLMRSVFVTAPALQVQLTRLMDKISECSWIRNAIVHGSHQIIYGPGEYHFTLMQNGALRTIVLTNERFDQVCSWMAAIKGAFEDLKRSRLGLADEQEYLALLRYQDRFAATHPF